MSEPGEITVLPATAERWTDFEAIMGERGGYGGCWCMLWRLQRPAFDAGCGASNRSAMKAIFEAGELPGLLAYDAGTAVAWCSVAPRAAFPRLERSRVLKAVDDQPVWSISCFLILKSHRKRGLTKALILGACDLVRERGGRILEAYPIEPKRRPYPPVFAWTGFAAPFLELGFREVLRRSATRPILRKDLTEEDSV